MITGGLFSEIRLDYNMDAEVVDFNSAVPDIEILWLECTISNHLFQVACCYDPPKPKYDPAALVNEFIADLPFIIDSQTQGRSQGWTSEICTNVWWDWPDSGQ